MERKGYKASTGEDAGKTNAKRQPKHRKGYKERIKEGKCKQDGKKGQEKGKASTVAKTEGKALDTFTKLHPKEGQWTMRFLRGARESMRTLHKKKHLQPHVAVQRIKPGMSMYKVQHILARKSSRVPKMDDKKVRRGNSKKHRRTLS